MIYIALVVVLLISFFLYALIADGWHSASIILVAIVIVCCLGGCVQFDRQWSSENRRLEAVYQVVHAIDGIQTLQIANQPERYSESSWMLPDHPTTGQALVWYMGTAYGHTFITDALDEHAPVWVCRAWQTLTILDAANAVRGNYQLGLRMGF